MNRRDMIALSIAGGAAMTTVVRPASARARRSGADDSPEQQAAVAGGVAYFSKQCDAQAKLCKQPKPGHLQFSTSYEQNTTEGANLTMQS